MGFLHPLVGDQPQHLPAPDIQRSMQHPTCVAPSHGDADLLPHPAVATVQRWGLQNQRLVKHQDHCPFPFAQPAFEPPLACRQVGDCRATVYRGRFQRTRSRANARLTL